MQKPYRRGTVLLIWVALSLSGAAAGREALPLIEAVQRGDVEAVGALLQRRVDVNAPAVDGSTALMWAVHRHDLSMVDRLVRAGADVKRTNAYGMAPLSMAAESGNAAIVERLLKAGADPNTTFPGGETALMTAARAGTADAVKALLAHGANVNAKETTRDQTALMWAAAQGRTAALKVLIEAGADITARSSELKAFHQNTFIAGHKRASATERLPMFTPFLFAVRGGHLDTARALLEAGANVNDAGPDETPALHIAIVNAYWELAAMLVDRGADVQVESAGGTALHHIARARAGKFLVLSEAFALPVPEPTGTMSSLDLAKKLLVLGANPNARMSKLLDAAGERNGAAKAGLTPLMMAQVLPGAADPEYARLLIAHGADPKLTSNNKTTILMMAAGIGLGKLIGDDEQAFENVKMAIELGVDVNATNEDGDTALHGAAFRNYLPILQYLVDHGARLDAKNKIGWTPLMEARWTARGLLTTRPEAEAFLRKHYEARGLPTTVRTREEAIEILYNAKGGPRIDCPPGVTVQSVGGAPTVLTYLEATASSGQYGVNKLKARCTPASGSLFPVGTTTVTCSATDDFGRGDSCTVLMRVRP